MQNQSKFFEISRLILFCFFDRNFAKISDTTVFESHLHQRLSSAKFGFNHHWRNTDNNFTFGPNARPQILSRAGQISARSIFCGQSNVQSKCVYSVWWWAKNMYRWGSNKTKSIYHFYWLNHQILGLRMGKMMAKIGLIMLLHKFDFECTERGELEFDNHSVVLVLKNGINLKVSNRK